MRGHEYRCHRSHAFRLPVLALPKASSNGVTATMFCSKLLRPALHSLMTWLTMYCRRNVINTQRRKKKVEPQPNLGGLRLACARLAADDKALALLGAQHVLVPAPRPLVGPNRRSTAPSKSGVNARFKRLVVDVRRQRLLARGVVRPLHFVGVDGQLFERVHGEQNVADICLVRAKKSV